MNDDDIGKMVEKAIKEGRLNKLSEEQKMKLSEAVNTMDEFSGLMKEAYVNFIDSQARSYPPEVMSKRFAHDMRIAFDPRRFPIELMLTAYFQVKNNLPGNIAYFHPMIKDKITNGIVMNSSDEQLRLIHDVKSYPQELYDEEIIVKATEKLYLPESEWEHLKK